MTTEPLTATSFITLVSKDEQTFKIPVAAAKLSGLVRNTLRDEDDDDGVDDTDEVDNNNTDGSAVEAVDLLRVSGTCLEKVVEFLNFYHQEAMNEIPVPLNGNSFEEVCRQEQYQKYMLNMEQSMIFDVLSAANYMEIKPLLDLACLRVTFMLSGRDAEEIRLLLNLPELTPEEEARARQDHRWIFEDN